MSKKVLIESANADSNWGDASMLHVAIRRISKMGSGLSIVLTDEHSAEIAEEYAAVRALSPEGRWAWRLQRPIWSRLDQLAPGLVDTFSVRLPGVKEVVTTQKMRISGLDTSKREEFLDTFSRARTRSL